MAQRMSLCSLVVQLDGHNHGPECGHQLVQHEDHYDYVGDDGELHHLLLAGCCEEHADHGPVIISHGSLSQLKRRRGAFGSPNTSPLKLSASDADTDVYTVTKIYCEGVCCPMEVPVVQNVLSRLPGIDKVDVAVVTKTVTVRHAPVLTSPAAIVAALEEARLNASLTFPRAQGKGKRTWVPPLHVLIATGFLIISLLHYFSTIDPSVAWMDHFKWVSLVSVAICLPGIMLKAFGALRHWVLDIHTLITIATAGAIAIGDYTEAGVVCVLFSIADFLETRCAGQARDAISAVLALKPETALVLSRAPGSGAVKQLLAEQGVMKAAVGFTPVEVPAVNVGVGSLILVRPGDKAPLDGVVVAGSSAFDESMLTGESLAVSKGAGDCVRAGTLNAGSGAVEVRTTVTSDDTFVAGMARLVEQATSRQSPAETAVAQFAKYYTPTVVLGCILLAFVPWATCPEEDRSEWVYLALQVLVTACPCALVLSTPATVVSALARAAQAGVLIKGGAVLETLGKVGTITLDKTGTLTRGSFKITSLDLAKHQGVEVMDETELLHLVGSLERGSSHPLAAAIVGRAAARGASCDGAVSAFSIVPGCGIEGVVDGKSVYCGTSELLTSLHVAGIDQLQADLRRCEDSGATTCFIAVESRYTACIAAKDVMRPESEEAITALRTLGIRTAILTGDNKSVALDVARTAGIDPADVHAGLLPEDKLEQVAAYKAAGGKRHKIAHVGDGINDAPALASADVGIAMGVAGAAAALEAGDVALFTNDLRVVAALHRLARSAAHKIAFNITLSVVTKIAVLVLAALGMFTLWGAVLVDVGTALLVTINGLHMLKFKFGLETADEVCVGAEAAKAGGEGGKSSSCCANGTCSAGTAPIAGATTKHDHSHKHEQKQGGPCCGEKQHSGHATAAINKGTSGCCSAKGGSGATPALLATVKTAPSSGCCGHKHEAVQAVGSPCCVDAAEKSTPCCATNTLPAVAVAHPAPSAKSCCGAGTQTHSHTHSDDPHSHTHSHSHSHKAEEGSHAGCGEHGHHHHQHHKHAEDDASQRIEEGSLGHLHDSHQEHGHSHDHGERGCCGGHGHCRKH